MGEDLPLAEGAPHGPEHELARTLSLAFPATFPERAQTSLHLAELFLDAAEAALLLERGGDAAAALDAIELLATRADVFAWDGPPGWDVVLASGLRPRGPLPFRPSPLDDLRAPSAPELQALAQARARSEAGHLLSAGRKAAAARSGEGASEAVVAAHASLLRLIGLAAVSSCLGAPGEEQPGELGPAGRERLLAEFAARAAAGSDIALAQEEWFARLVARNRSAREPGFRTFFAGISQFPRVALELREFARSAREGVLPRGGEALLGAVGGYQPLRWASLRRAPPSSWFSSFFPEAPPADDPLGRLAHECDLALDLAGNLFFAQDFSRAAFTGLTSLFTARCACALALWEELGGGPGPGRVATP